MTSNPCIAIDTAALRKRITHSEFDLELEEECMESVPIAAIVYFQDYV